MKTFTNGTVELSYEAFEGAAESETIILLHGFPQLASSWYPIARKLQESGYRILVPNQRGYPGTTAPRTIKDYSIKHLVSDVYCLMDATSTLSAHIVGHDWGGSVAWSFAHFHPERTRSLTVASMPHPQALLKSLSTSNQAIKSWYLLFLSTPWLAEQAVACRRDFGNRWLERTGLDRDHAKLYMDTLCQLPNSLRWPLNWYRALPFNLAEQPRKLSINVRTSYVWSSNDVAVSRKAAELTQDYVAGPYTLSILDGVSHWIPEEAPVALEKIVQSNVTAISHIP